MIIETISAHKCLSTSLGQDKPVLSEVFWSDLTVGKIKVIRKQQKQVHKQNLGKQKKSNQKPLKIRERNTKSYPGTGRG